MHLSDLLLSNSILKCIVDIEYIVSVQQPHARGAGAELAEKYPLNLNEIIPAQGKPGLRPRLPDRKVCISFLDSFFYSLLFQGQGRRSFASSTNSYQRQYRLRKLRIHRGSPGRPILLKLFLQNKEIKKIFAGWQISLIQTHR